MDCDKFLAEYTAFRDGELPWAEREAFEAHLERCPSCERYDRVVNRGVGVFRDLPDLAVSDDFGARLQQRLRREEAAASYARSGGVATVTFSLAGLVAFAAFLPTLGGGDRPARLDPVAAVAPRAASAANLTEELVRAGVRVRDLPYHELVYHRADVLAGTLAMYDPGAFQDLPVDTSAR